MIVLKKKKGKQTKKIMSFIIGVSIINIVVLCLFWQKNTIVMAANLQGKCHVYMK